MKALEDRTSFGAFSLLRARGAGRYGAFCGSGHAVDGTGAMFTDTVIRWPPAAVVDESHQTIERTRSEGSSSALFHVQRKGIVMTDNPKAHPTDNAEKPPTNGWSREGRHHAIVRCASGSAPISDGPSAGGHWMRSRRRRTTRSIPFGRCCAGPRSPMPLPAASTSSDCRRCRSSGLETPQRGAASTSGTNSRPI